MDAGHQRLLKTTGSGEIGYSAGQDIGVHLAGSKHRALSFTIGWQPNPMRQTAGTGESNSIFSTSLPRYD
jgi:hypothetical protein